jgi:hypothetical protein
MQDFYGTLYPYQDFKNSYISQVLNPIRRVLYPINPFASQQVPTHDSVGLGERYGNMYFKPPTYQTGAVFTNLFPNHYDPSSDKNPTEKQADNIWGATPGPGCDGHLVNFEEDLPRACERARFHHNRCKMINGEEKCDQEADYVMGVCPDWALNEIKNQRRFEYKVHLIQKTEYDSAMEVSSYNKGITTASVSNKTHIHGTRQYLRPDTMWADERYVNVTRDEIKAAKERYVNKQKAAGLHNNALKPEPHMFDNTGAQMKQQGLIY